MAQVISLDEYRERRDPLPTAIRRLDAAVARLDPLVRGRSARLTPSIERELAAISDAVSAGDPREAAERAERLADLLEHPAVGGGA
jgi:hypothetical protein